MNKVLVIFDMQFGSTGKGQVAGTLASKWEPDTVVTAWAPNAGHTLHWGGQKYVSTMLASCAIFPTIRNILIGPGSVVDLDKLSSEITAAKAHLVDKNLIIHPNAAILMSKHAKEEEAFVRIGSTMKGSAAAVIQKMQRDPANTNIAGHNKSMIVDALTPWDRNNQAPLRIKISEKAYDDAINSSQRMIVEGAQGYSLGIHTNFYPYTTSRDVSVHQILADCRIPRGGSVFVVGVCRTFPIRVANRYDDKGNMIGTSGTCYADQQEVDWKDIGVSPELTTVTKLPRRVFTLSAQQLADASRLVNPDMIVLTFADYIDKVTDNLMMPEELKAAIRRIELCTGSKVKYTSFGPTLSDMYAIGHDYLVPHNDPLFGQPVEALK